MAHTKGPWDVDGFVVFGPRPVHDMTQPGYPMRQESICRITAKMDQLEDCANGFLIAAAPDLLEACRTAQAFLQETHDYAADHITAKNEAIASLSAAIMKAVGEPADPFTGPNDPPSDDEEGVVQ